MVEQGLNAEQMKEALQEQGEEREEDLRRRLKATFVLEKIADQEKVFATEEEVDNRIQLLAGLYGVPYSRLRDEMESTGRIEELRFSLREEKARAFLVSQARVVGPGGSEAPAAEETKETMAGEAPATGETVETMAGEAPATGETVETMAGEAPAAETTTPSAEGHGSAQEGGPSQG
jgi:trigger factor